MFHRMLFSPDFQLGMELSAVKGAGETAGSLRMFVKTLI